jgi:hypothetical protein
MSADPGPSGAEEGPSTLESDGGATSAARSGERSESPPTAESPPTSEPEQPQSWDYSQQDWEPMRLSPTTSMFGIAPENTCNYGWYPRLVGKIRMLVMVPSVVQFHVFEGSILENRNKFGTGMRY